MGVQVNLSSRQHTIKLYNNLKRTESRIFILTTSRCLLLKDLPAPLSRSRPGPPSYVDKDHPPEEGHVPSKELCGWKYQQYPRDCLHQDVSPLTGTEPK